MSDGALNAGVIPMSWFLFFWAYLVAGEITALLALTDEAATASVQWLAYRGSWWLPYAGAAAFVLAWPIAVTFVLLFPSNRH
jgi:hypothetical protein